MPKISPKEYGTDWDKVAEGAVVPDGRYVARVSDVQEREGKESGNPYLNIELTIQEPEEFLGRKLWDVFMLSANALWKLRNFCKTIGFDLTGAAELDTDDLQDLVVGVQVTTEVYQERERNRVKGYFTAK